MSHLRKPSVPHLSDVDFLNRTTLRNAVDPDSATQGLRPCPALESMLSPIGQWQQITIESSKAVSRAYTISSASIERLSKNNKTYSEAASAGYGAKGPSLATRQTHFMPSSRWRKGVIQSGTQTLCKRTREMAHSMEHGQRYRDASQVVPWPKIG